jgi:hypothetical protein
MRFRFHCKKGDTAMIRVSIVALMILNFVLAVLTLSATNYDPHYTVMSIAILDTIVLIAVAIAGLYWRYSRNVNKPYQLVRTRCDVCGGKQQYRYAYSASIGGTARQTPIPCSNCGHDPSRVRIAAPG